MNAAVVHSYDQPPRYETFADPVPTIDEVLIDVSAAGLHPIVKSLAKGAHYGSTGQLPSIPGVDGVGRTPDGTRVLFGSSRPPYGTFAERSITRRAMCTPLPANLDDAVVAAMINPAMSSWAALEHRAHFVNGESILILGATGCAGHLAVQVARRLGAKRVVAVGRNPQALEETKSLGADAVISLNQDRETLIAAFRAEINNGIDVVLDYLWGPPAEALLAAVVQKGLDHASGHLRYVQIGNSAGATIPLAAAALRSTGLEILGSGFGSASLADLVKAVAALLQEAARQPFVFQTTAMPLRDVTAAWAMIDSASRIVLQP